MDPKAMMNPPLVMPRAAEPDRYGSIRWLGIFAGFACCVVTWWVLLVSLFFISTAGVVLLGGFGLVLATGASALYGQVPPAPCRTWVRAVVGIVSTLTSLVLITVVLFLL